MSLDKGKKMLNHFMTSLTSNEEFKRIIPDFVRDMKTSFPEYKLLIEKWWKDDSFFDYISEETERQETIKNAKNKSIDFLFQFCSKKYPLQFMDILNENTDIFSDESQIDTEFLPNIHFKNIWQMEVSDSIKESIWKYLQLVLFSIVRDFDTKVNDCDERLIEMIGQDSFKTTLEESLDKIKEIFQNQKIKNGHRKSQEKNLKTKPKMKNPICLTDF